MAKRDKVTVLLDADEYVRFEAFCALRGLKKSTLIARHIRDFLDSEQFQAQLSLPLEKLRGGKGE